MRWNIRSVNSTLRTARALNDQYESNELNLPLADRYSAGVFDMGGRWTRFMQQCCARVCALVPFSTCNMHVATRCNRVANRVQHCAPNNDAICWDNNARICRCVEMLLSFGRSITRSERLKSLLHLESVIVALLIISAVLTYFQLSF